jgi:hypothetical protein
MMHFLFPGILQIVIEGGDEDGGVGEKEDEQL